VRGKSFAEALRAFGVNVALNATREELLKARKRALVQFHPDRMLSKGEPWHKIVEAEEIYKLLQNLHEQQQQQQQQQQRQPHRSQTQAQSTAGGATAEMYRYRKEQAVAEAARRAQQNAHMRRDEHERAAAQVRGQFSFVL
jgi:DnaJ-class molecular chaperone